jgi:hypothetical protein
MDKDNNELAAWTKRSEATTNRTDETQNEVTTQEETQMM